MKGAGSVATGIADYSQNEAKLKQAQDQFNKTYSLQNNAQTLAVQKQLDRAPIVDKAQYGIENAAAPTPFQPRDYTQAAGFTGLATPPTGGPAAQLAANNAASAKYTPGAGGVDTDTMKLILQRLKGAA